MRYWDFAATSGDITNEETVAYQFKRGMEEGKEAVIPRKVNRSEEKPERTKSYPKVQ